MLPDDIATLHVTLAQARDTGFDTAASREALVRIIENSEGAIRLAGAAVDALEYADGERRAMRERLGADLDTLKGRAGSAQSVADPGLTPERRSALFVLNDLRDKLAEMELHDDLPDSHDIGYMAAWREIKEWADGR